MRPEEESRTLAEAVTPLTSALALSLLLILLSVPTPHPVLGAGTWLPPSASSFS